MYKEPKQIIERLEKTILGDLFTPHTADGGVWVDLQDLRALVDHIKHLEQLKEEHMKALKDWEEYARE